MLTSVRIVGGGNEAVARRTPAFVAAAKQRRKAGGERKPRTAHSHPNASQSVARIHGPSHFALSTIGRDPSRALRPTPEEKRPFLLSKWGCMTWITAEHLLLSREWSALISRFLWVTSIRLWPWYAVSIDSSTWACVRAVWSAWREGVRYKKPSRSAFDTEGYWCLLSDLTGTSLFPVCAPSVMNMA